MCRSRRGLSNEYFLAKFGFDTAENEPCKVCPLSVYISPRSSDVSTSIPNGAPCTGTASFSALGHLEFASDVRVVWTSAHSCARSMFSSFFPHSECAIQCGNRCSCARKGELGPHRALNGRVYSGFSLLEFSSSYCEWRTFSCSHFLPFLRFS